MSLATYHYYAFVASHSCTPAYRQAGSVILFNNIKVAKIRFSSEAVKGDNKKNGGGKNHQAKSRT